MGLLSFLVIYIVEEIAKKFGIVKQEDCTILFLFGNFNPDNLNILNTLLSV